MGGDFMEKDKIEELIINIQETSSYINSLNEGIRLLICCNVKNKDLHITNSLEVLDLLSNNISDYSSKLISLLK